MQQKFEDAGLKFDPVSFTYSFRSGPAILHAVDHVFREQDIFRSIHAVDIGNPIHHALADAGPSQIDLWELAEADDRQDIEGWRAPFDGVAATSPEVKLSRRIQAEIKTLVDSGAMTGSKSDRRPLRYGDMLVLVRRRGNAFDAVIQALKHAGIPVAGADRLKLTEHIAIIDLMNLADALLLPQDDLALAVALKSPLFGLTDDDLFKLAWQRKGSLRAALTDARRDRRPAAGRAVAARTMRAPLCQRNAVCVLCLAARRRRRPRAHPAAARTRGQRRARRISGTRAELRAQGAGLAAGFHGVAARGRSRGEARHGNLARRGPRHDGARRQGPGGFRRVPGGHHDIALGYAAAEAHQPAAGQCRPHAPGVVVWAGRKADDPPAVAAARAAMIDDTEDEYRRLLYVAMTRAADRLIVGGCMPGNMKSCPAAVLVRSDRPRASPIPDCSCRRSRPPSAG